MWTDPAWVRWQIQHRAMGDPAAYTNWLMKKVGRVIRHQVLPTMRAFTRTMSTTADSFRRFAVADEGEPDE